MVIDQETPENMLIKLWCAGEQREEIFTLLQERYAPQLARLFRRMHFQSEAGRDLVQESLLQAFRGLERFNGRSSLRTWLFQIARNAGRKKLRSEHAQKRDGEEVSLEIISQGKSMPSSAFSHPTADPHRLAVVNETCQLVRAAVDELPPTDRQIVLLRVYQDLSVRETALILKKPEGTIKSGWSRIRKTLGEKLAMQISHLPS